MKMKVLTLLIVFILPLTALSQETCHCPSMAPVGKGTLYFGFGYNLDYYSVSDIHYEDHGSDQYDFVLHDVTAADRPGLDQILTSSISIPQYSVRIGYYFNKKQDWGIEFNYDHAKYVMDHNQVVRITGTIRGEKLDKDTVVGGNEFMDYEHTNGANFAMFDVVRRFNFLHSKNELHWVSAVGKAGVGFVYPRTDVTIMGVNRDDQFHVAGYIAGLELGVRYDFMRHFYFETSFKGSYANYTNVLLPETGRANQHFLAWEYVMIIGFQFPL